VLFVFVQFMETSTGNSQQWLPRTRHRSTTCAYILVAEVVARKDNKGK